MSAWLAGRKPTTMAAYRKDLEAFTSWLQLDDDRAGTGDVPSHPALAVHAYGLSEMLV